MTGPVGLFGQPLEPEPRRGRRRHPIEPATISAEVGDTAARLPRHVHLGTSSWSFPGWTGLVWSADAPAPSQSRLAKEGLEVYARHPLLRAVGVDRTFYGPVTEETFRAWHDAVPDDFRFLVKAPRATVEPRTHQGDVNPAFLGAQRLVDELVTPATRGLREKLGVIVLQFPPVPFRRPDEPGRLLERLAGFLADLRSRTDATIAVEVRNRVLIDDGHRPAYRQALEAGDVGHCYTVHPSMPDISRQIAELPPLPEGPIAVRWMLHAGETYQSARDRYQPFDRLVDPDPAVRTAIATLAREAVDRTVIVIANNKAEGSAPLTLARLADAIAG